MSTRITIICALGLLSCGEGKRYGEGEGGSSGLGSGDDGSAGGDDGGGGGPGDGDGGDDDGDDDDDGRSAGVQGRVWVELYTEDADGDHSKLTWEEAMGAAPVFPFGSIFVAAFDEVDDEKVYFDQDTVIRPSVDGDYYTLAIDPEETDQVNVYATLDIRGDGILGTGEPIGVWGDDIQIRRGTEADDVDIAIMVNWGIWGPGGSGWGWGGGGGAGGGAGGLDGGSDSCGTIAMSGDVEITNPYGGGNGMAMLLDLDGHGPYLYEPFTPIVTPDGAEADFMMRPPCHVGAYQLVGAYDSNGNALIDPMDQWGAYAESSGINGNPVTIAGEDLPSHDIEIPLDGGTCGLSVVPFVRLSGTLFPFEGGTLDEFGDTDTKVYVVALKYPASVDVPVASFEDAYDVEVFDAEDLAGASSVDWDLIVPTNIRVYVWGFMDVDGDRVVNEVDELVACGGTGDKCALPVGEDHHEGIPLGIQVAG